MKTIELQEAELVHGGFVFKIYKNANQEAVVDAHVMHDSEFASSGIIITHGPHVNNWGLVTPPFMH